MKAYRQRNKEQLALKYKAEYEANKQDVLARKKLYRAANLDRAREVVRVYQQTQRKECADTYVMRLLKEQGLPARCIPQELVEAKRLHLLIKRELKNEQHH
jgi:Flp pilus assembly protein TadD